MLNEAIMRDSVHLRTYTGLGDQLLLTPVIAAIKRRRPEIKINVDTCFPEVFYGNPYVCSTYLDSDDGTHITYSSPKDGAIPTKHIIDELADSAANQLDMPGLRAEHNPELYCTWNRTRSNRIAVQTIHVGQWHEKKIWPYFAELATRDGFEAIPHFHDVFRLFNFVAGSACVVCAEGAISHIAKAVGTPAVVIYGGWAKPEWNGYQEHVNVCDPQPCSYCWNPEPCVSEPLMACMAGISVERVAALAMEAVS